MVTNSETLKSLTTELTKREKLWNILKYFNWEYSDVPYEHIDRRPRYQHLKQYLDQIEEIYVSND